MPNYNEMSFEDMQKIYTFNNLRRARLLNRANKLSTDKEKVQFIVDYFTNNLPTNILAEIDDVEEKLDSLNGAFTVIDRASHGIAGIADSVVGTFGNVVSKFGRKRK